MNDYEELSKFLDDKGWVLECYSPLEIRNKISEESFASNLAAEIIIDYLRNQINDD